MLIPRSSNKSYFQNIKRLYLNKSTDFVLRRLFFSFISQIFFEDLLYARDKQSEVNILIGFKQGNRR